MRTPIDAISPGISPSSTHGRAWLAAELGAHGSEGLCNYEYDTMTGRSNRTFIHVLLDAVIQQARSSGRGLGIALVDLDDFKVLSETVAYTYAQELLKLVAQRLSCLRADVVVGHLGGDRFLVFAVLAIAEKISLLAGELVKKLSTPFFVANAERAITVSVGTCCYPNDGAQAPALIRYAEAALSRAKQAGRECVREFKAEMISVVQRRAVLQPELRKAIDTRTLRVFYQPKFSRKTCNMVGVEALLRWEHPVRGSILPEEFIGIAERSNLIVELGIWVLRKACKDTVSMMSRSGVPLTVAVNVSMHQFNDTNFSNIVKTILRQSGLPPENLELEITESVLAQDIAETASAMEAISDCGVILSIDDFGTGYSSLSYLQRLPIKKLKLDRSSIQTLTEKNKLLAQAVFTLAHEFDLVVVAEGVEGIGEYTWLCDAGCDEVQGFLLGRPMHLNSLSALL